MSFMEQNYKLSAGIHRFNKRLEDSDAISEENKAAVTRFITKCKLEGLAPGRIIKLSKCLGTILRLAGKDFDLLNAEKGDLEFLVMKIMEGTKRDGSPFAPSYKNDLKGILKKFYKTMQPDENGEFPAKVRWIKAPMRTNSKKIPEPLTQEELDKLMVSAQNDRMRCMLKILMEGGIRAGELLNLRVKDVEFTDYGVKLSVSGKTGHRKILLIESERYLRNWLSQHPYETERDVPLWVKVKQRTPDGAEANRIYHGTFRILLHKVAIRAGVRITTVNGKKKCGVHPHLFRHTRATQLASKLKEATMKEYFGWKQSSKMTQTYVHMSGRDVDIEIMRMNGILPKEEKEETRECPRCFRINKGADFCGRCSMPLNLYAARKKEDVQKDLQSVLGIMIENGITKEQLREIFVRQS